MAYILLSDIGHFEFFHLQRNEHYC